MGIKYISENEEILTTSIKPVKTGEDYKLGLWVRDAAAGVGTLTFIIQKIINVWHLDME